MRDVAVDPVVDSTRSTDSPVRRTYTQTNWTKRRKTDGDRVHPVLRTRLFRWYHAFEQHPVGVGVNTLTILVGIAVYEYFSLVPALTLDPSEATGWLARKTVPLDVNFFLPRVPRARRPVLPPCCLLPRLRRALAGVPPAVDVAPRLERRRHDDAVDDAVAEGVVPATLTATLCASLSGQSVTAICLWKRLAKNMRCAVDA